MMHRMGWAAMLLCCVTGFGCGSRSGPYLEPDTYIEKEWQEEDHVLADFEQVLADGGTVGYVKTMQHLQWDRVDYYVYDFNLKQVGYVDEDGATYEYSPRFERLMFKGHFDLQGSVRLLLRVKGDYYILPATADVQWDELQAMQPDRSAAAQPAEE